jgi:hypothetical protein
MAAALLGRGATQPPVSVKKAACVTIPTIPTGIMVRTEVEVGADDLNGQLTTRYVCLHVWTAKLGASVPSCSPLERDR